MKTSIRKITDEKYITDSKGKVEFIVVPVKEYERVMDLLEDYGLGLAIKQAEGEKKYKKNDALKFLEND